MASQDDLRKLQAAIAADDQDQDMPLPGDDGDDALIDFGAGAEEQPLAEALKPPAQPDKSADIAAQIEAARREAAQEAADRHEAALADALARQRAEMEASIEAQKASAAQELEQLQAYREKERENATKCSPAERNEYVEIYGEERAEKFIARDEAARRKTYDLENELRAMREQVTAKPAAASANVPDGFVAGVDDINNGFSGFNEIAKTVGGVTWSDFTRTEKFKKAAQDPEFKALWSSAFYVKDGVISGVNPTFAKLANKKLAELMAGEKPSGFTPQPQRSAAPKLSTGAGNGEEGPVIDRSAMRQAFRKGDQKAIAAIAKQIH
jgi:hypothetical protein